MDEQPEYGDAEREFQGALERLIGSRPIKVWLTISRQGRLDTLFSVGTAHGDTIRHFDHAGGFYLLGENIPPDLLDPIHKLLMEYCRSQHRLLHANTALVMNWQYRHFGFHPAPGRHHLVMHVPFAVNDPHR